MPVGTVYAERLAARRAEAERLAGRERLLSILRLVVIAVVILTIWLAGWWALLPLAGFVALVVLHDRVITAKHRAENAMRFYDRGLARVEDRWAGTGSAGEEFKDDRHPYAIDLDLFGEGSVFELMCIASTQAGRARLAHWLKEPSDSPAEIASRQRAVGELRDRLDLREDLAIRAAEVSREIESARLGEWGAQPPLLTGGRWLVLLAAAIASVLFVITAPLLVVKLVGLTLPWSFPTWPFLLALIAASAVAGMFRAPVQQVIAAVERAEPALALLARLTERLEREPFETDRLLQLRARLVRDGQPASQQIERLRRLVGLLDARRNQYFAPFAAVMLWTTNFAFSIERWRRKSGGEIASWIDAVSELEALSSLASFAYEHPTFTVPEIVPEASRLEATALGHPLIPAARRVPNDLRLGQDQRLLVISGSNMSGKSTMLRSTGLAAVLAMAGAHVCAERLRMAPMRVGASIQLHDSLAEGASRFYAEILRIRQILDLAKEGRPLLFLLDEILHGTNSHDRRIGAEGIVKSLLARGAVGLVSTHDLALAEIAGATNVHFEDHMDGDRMAFDYRMHPGVVTRSNALALMRAVGIEV
ncbi:MAG TPA: DNA mismatch repair protein MutS [Thermoanaerobaculia bacterium]|nr:DNA mismatch repair protein MutS [Thermoanaerobaculia bacterium]